MRRRFLMTARRRESAAKKRFAMLVAVRCRSDLGGFLLDVLSQEIQRQGALPLCCNSCAQRIYLQCRLRLVMVSLSRETLPFCLCVGVLRQSSAALFYSR